jgi:hypothetical protein
MSSGDCPGSSGKLSLHSLKLGIIIPLIHCFSGFYRSFPKTLNKQLGEVMILSCKCKSCGTEFDVECDEWELVSSSDREDGMGQKSSYQMTIHGSCPNDKCSKRHLTIELFEHVENELDPPLTDFRSDEVERVDGWCERISK